MLVLLNLFNELCTTAFSRSRQLEDTISKKVIDGRATAVDGLDVLYPEDISFTGQKLREQILGRYSQRAGGMRSEFIDHLKRDSNEYLHSRNLPKMRVPSREILMAQSMMSVVDRIFSVIEPYIMELRQEFQGTELSVSMTEPQMVSEAVEFDSMRRPSTQMKSYRGRISSTRLSVVVRGCASRVDFFLIPVEQVMGLSKTEDEHKPIMSFTGTDTGVSIEWEVEEKPLTAERLERYSLLLLDYFMERTREELGSARIQAPLAS